MRKDLIIIGAGSVGGQIASNLKDYFPAYNLLGFLDDDISKKNTFFVDYPVLGTVDQITEYNTDINIVIGIAFPKIKFRVINKIKNFGYHNFPNLISSAAWISRNVTMGEGCLIYPGTSINYNTNIGDFVIFNMNCAIGHDCKIGNNISFAPGVLLGGNTSIADYTEIGIGSKCLQGINIGSCAKIGAGTVIINDVPDNVVVVGNPGRVIKINKVINLKN